MGHLSNGFMLIILARMELFLMDQASENVIVYNKCDIAEIIMYHYDLDHVPDEVVDEASDWVIKDFNGSAVVERVIDILDFRMKKKIRDLAPKS
jgi:hypothetical protein